MSGAVVYYWIHEFETLNYRAGAETDLDALVSHRRHPAVARGLPAGARLAMTSIGVGMLAYAYFGAYLPEVIAHRGFGIERLAPRST